jgi:hypothetical protein
MCMMLSAGWEEGGLLVYDHRSCILPGASSQWDPNSFILNLILLLLVRMYTYKKENEISSSIRKFR